MKKQFAALGAAMMFGVWSGVSATAKIAYPDVMGQVPSWMSAARSLRTMALVAFVVCALGWIALDWLAYSDPDA